MIIMFTFSKLTHCIAMITGHILACPEPTLTAVWAWVNDLFHHLSFLPLTIPSTPPTAIPVITSPYSLQQPREQVSEASCSEVGLLLLHRRLDKIWGDLHLIDTADRISLMPLLHPLVLTLVARLKTRGLLDRRRKSSSKHSSHHYLTVVVLLLLRFNQYFQLKLAYFTLETKITRLDLTSTLECYAQRFRGAI